MAEMKKLTQPQIVSTRKRVASIFDATDKYASKTEEVNDKILQIFRGLTYNLADDIKMLSPKERVELSIRLMPHLANMIEFTKAQDVNAEQKNQYFEMFRRVQ